MQQIHQIFHSSFDFIVAPQAIQPQWETISSHRLADAEMDRLWSDPDLLIGIRPQNTSNYLLIDIDRLSKYHPSIDRYAWDDLVLRLEQLGLIDPIYVRSSHNGGIHIYYWFNESIESFKLAALVRIWLEDEGMLLSGGQIETFPNTKSYDSKYNAHRLPLQSGSILLDQFGDPLDHPANRDQESRLAYFINHSRTSEQSISSIKSRLKWGYDRYLKKRQYSHTRSGINVAEWKQNWEKTIELGWTGRGQTNELLHVIIGYAIVFEGIEDKHQLFDHVKSQVLRSPGYRQYCNHQHQIDRRIWDWVNLTIDRNYYTPYQSRPGRTGEYPGLTIDQSEAKRPKSTKRHDSIIDRITITVQTIIEHLGALPTLIRDRIKLIIDTSRELFGSGFGINTLYKSCYVGLWQEAETAEIRQEAETVTAVCCSQFCDREINSENNPETVTAVCCSQFCDTMKLISPDEGCSADLGENLPQVSKSLPTGSIDLSNIYSPVPNLDPQSEIEQLADRSINIFSSSSSQSQDLDPDSLDPKSLPETGIESLKHISDPKSLPETGIESLKHISDKIELCPPAKFLDSISSANESGDISLECPGSIELPPVGALVIRPEHTYRGKKYPSLSGIITANFGINCELISASGVGYRYRFELSDWLVSWFPAC